MRNISKIKNMKLSPSYNLKKIAYLILIFLTVGIIIFLDSEVSKTNTSFLNEKALEGENKEIANLENQEETEIEVIDDVHVLPFRSGKKFLPEKETSISDFEEGKYYIVQFEDKLPKDVEEVKKLGITPVNFLNTYTIVAKIESGYEGSELVRWIGEMNPEDKMGSYTRGVLSSRMQNGEDIFTMVVEGYEDVEKEELEEVINSVGAKPKDHSAFPKNTIMIEGDYDQINEVLQSNKIIFVFPAIDGLIQGKDLIFMSHARTPYGAATRALSLVSEGWEGPGRNMDYNIGLSPSLLTLNIAAGEDIRDTDAVVRRAFDIWKNEVHIDAVGAGSSDLHTITVTTSNIALALAYYPDDVVWTDPVRAGDVWLQNDSWLVPPTFRVNPATPPASNEYDLLSVLIPHVGMGLGLPLGEAGVSSGAILPGTRVQSITEYDRYAMRMLYCSREYTKPECSSGVPEPTPPDGFDQPEITTTPTPTPEPDYFPNYAEVEDLGCGRFGRYDAHDRIGGQDHWRWIIDEPCVIDDGRSYIVSIDEYFIGVSVVAGGNLTIKNNTTLTVRNNVKIDDAEYANVITENGGRVIVLNHL